MSLAITRGVDALLCGARCSCQAVTCHSSASRQLLQPPPSDNIAGSDMSMLHCQRGQFDAGCIHGSAFKFCRGVAQLFVVLLHCLSNLLKLAQLVTDTNDLHCVISAEVTVVDSTTFQSPQLSVTQHLMPVYC